ncbi:DUF1456 family protein [Leeia sp. TBRC 13508]|uniref:DUF1456 family protein n=1 Tax=Leeia speluncae TaxID=2884804 RepID=A0ABS8D748_9NEIS|nr:DUF1456 family protein [Leeia speluncae]MCB6184009.1 DUF1456 family protein [Leeia speluncae]
MNANDILRSLRYAMDLSEPQLAKVINEGGEEIDPDTLRAYLKKEEEEGFLPCPETILGAFLDGLVYVKRGRDDSKPQLRTEPPISHNLVLKKLRVAFELKDTDIQSLLANAGLTVTTGELSALFRKPDHRHYRTCGDQFLRNFLKGLTLKLRG